MDYIVHRITDNNLMQIKVVVSEYMDELYKKLQQDNLGENILEIEYNFDDAMTSARVYSRAYRELFYRNYDVQISVESNGQESKNI